MFVQVGAPLCHGKRTTTTPSPPLTPQAKTWMPWHLLMLQCILLALCSYAMSDKDDDEKWQDAHEVGFNIAANAGMKQVEKN